MSGLRLLLVALDLLLPSTGGTSVSKVTALLLNLCCCVVAELVLWMQMQPLNSAVKVCTSSHVVVETGAAHADVHDRRSLPHPEGARALHKH